MPLGAPVRRAGIGLLFVTLLVTGWTGVGRPFRVANGEAEASPYVAVAASTDGTRDAALLAAIKARVDERKSVGMVVGTIDADGGTSRAFYGSAGEGARPLDADSVFEIGSITKVFTATLLADMVDRGEVKLTDPVSQYLPPNVKVPQREGRQITLLELSTQSSGLPRMPDNLRPRDPSNPYADYTVEQMYEFLGRYQLTRDIGAEYEYSNLGVALLGHALARRAGKSYEALLQERVLRPLGMEHTAITLTPWMKAHLVKGHDASGQPAPNWDLPTFAGAGALRSTLNDMLKFARANLQPSGARINRVLQQTHGARFTAGRPDMSIGLNWHIRHYNDHDIVWHNGGTGGYRSWLGFDEKRKLAAVILTNSQQANDDLGYELLK
ncbi:MAG TPA: serine hydrolase domain-containing protein [Vicinamibacterales bacterium]